MPSVLEHVAQVTGRFDPVLYRQVIGAANAFKQGDAAIGVAAADETARARARALLAETSVEEIHSHPLHEDAVWRVGRDSVDRDAYARVRALHLAELKALLLERPEGEVRAVARGLDSDVIACVVRLASDDELRALGGRVFNPLPGSRIGARGYLGARIQPNSPTDNPEDILWQVFDAFAYAVGDVLVGTNPVDGRPESVAIIERTLAELVEAFGLDGILPHCVLSHVDVQAEVERLAPGSTGLWFQSLAGTERANRTFGLTVDGMLAYARQRTGRFGLYLETGQGADFTNGHASGFDMVAHESRKYGFARALKQQIEAVTSDGAGWLVVNDVAGFIGPEVFTSREQLVRCCLEDIVMGKLHGLTIGLDVCSTLHMSVTPEDLEWCLDRIVPACPAYLMALPTRNDPMLSYLTTSFHDHVRLRETYCTKVDDRMWAFYQRLGVIDAAGRPTRHFGDPLWVWVRYRRALGDERAADEILAEGRARAQAVMGRGVPLAFGHGKRIWDPEPALEVELRRLYADAKESLRASLPGDFVAALPGALAVTSRSADRDDYIAHPMTGEELSEGDEEQIAGLVGRREEPADLQIVVSDGLNARALSDPGHLLPYLEALRPALAEDGWVVAPELIVITNGRVRAGYRCGELLFGRIAEGRDLRAIVHVIGERPGSGHHNFSAYLAVAAVSAWSTRGAVDHDSARVVSGISDTALDPATAAGHTVTLLDRLRAGVNVS